MTMAIGELDNPDASGGRELPPAASSDAQAHPENTRASADRDQRSDTARHPRAETLTRQQYSDAMRAQGPPAPSRDSPGDDPLATARRDAPAPDRADRDHGRKPAEPRDRASYAADMRVSAADPLMDAGPSREGQDATRAYGSPLDGPSTDRGQSAEPRGRGEYADAIRALPAEASQQHQIFRLDASEPPDSSTDLAEATEGPSGDSADGVARGDGDRTGPDDQPAPQQGIDSSQQDRPLYREGPEDTSPQDALPPAGVSQAGRPADDLNGQGVETAADELPRDLGDSGNASSGSEKAYVDGREVEVTHQPADGIWVSGLPGEMPETPYGDPYGTAKVGEVVPGDAPPRSRADRLFSTFCERGDDLTDIAEKGLDEMQHILGPRPPTITESPVGVNLQAPETPHLEIDAGSMATALLALGVGAWGLHRMLERRHELHASPEKGT
jgi:hypothetical protein